jgi:hypothetical protein
MTQPLEDQPREDIYGRPIKHYELPLLEPARQRSERIVPELDANNRPCSACPKCNGGRFWLVPHTYTLWYCIDCYQVAKGPVEMFVGKVKR